MSTFSIVTSTNGVTTHTLDFSSPLFSLTNWAQMIARQCPHVVRFQFEEADTNCEVEDNNIRFAIFKDGKFVGYSEWISLSFFNEAFRTYSRSIGLNFLDGDQEVIVETEDGNVFINVPEMDYVDICEQTTYGNGPVEYDTLITTTAIADTTLHMSCRLELLPNMEDRLFCVLSLDHAL